MNARQQIEAAFFSRFFQEDRRYIGTELEFPLVSLSGGSVSDEVIEALPAFLLENGFSVGETDMHGNGVFLVNDDGDCLSFDNSYNNFEFAMAKDENLLSVAKRFYNLYCLVQNFLLTKNHTLCGMGTNLHYGKAETKPVDYPIYCVLRRFLAEFEGGYFHRITDFPAWLSSVQTHLDVEAARLPRALTLFASMDFVRGLLFSNSLPIGEKSDDQNIVCFRDYLWEHSGFGSLADNTGAVCGTFATLDDITDLFCKKSMFLTCNDGQYAMIPPVSLEEFLNEGKEANLLDGYLSFKNVEITRRGTLEIRSDCSQPLGAAFAPPAFNLGILSGLSEAEELMEDFFARLPQEYSESPKRNALLRHMVIQGETLPVKAFDLQTLLIRLVALAEDKLKERALGEEQLPRPLFHRAETLLCPAKVVRQRLATGDSLASVMTDFSNPNYVI